jgi:glucose-1-phosphate thymidylyltransferase
MKGVILAGGTGSRLSPLTKVTNKHLLPVGDLPMILHSIKKLIKSGIIDIMIVTGTEHMGDLVSLIGSGREYGCNCTYRVQDTPDGIAGALSLCESFVGEDSVIVILGDNIFEDDLACVIEKYSELKTDRAELPTCALSLKKVPDPHRFGVAEIKDNKIVSIEEKPQNPKSVLCITGIYLYDRHVFDIIKTLKKSDRGEYEITDVNNEYIRAGGVAFTELKGWWTDAGTHESYYKANILTRREKNYD